MTKPAKPGQHGGYRPSVKEPAPAMFSPPHSAPWADLTPRQKEETAMYYRQYLSYRETARVVGAPLGGICHAVRRASNPKNAPHLVVDAFENPALIRMVAEIVANELGLPSADAVLPGRGSNASRYPRRIFAYLLTQLPPASHYKANNRGSYRPARDTDGNYGAVDRVMRRRRGAVQRQVHRIAEQRDKNPEFDAFLSRLEARLSELTNGTSR